MSNAAIHASDVRALQRLAEETSQQLRTAPPKRTSRAALLELIDILSRWSAAGLGLVAGAAIYMAITAGRVYPGRALAWTILLLGSLVVCRRLREEFRAGAAIAAKPFRWRASYTSCLSVLGVIFASAPLLLTPSGAPEVLALQIMALTFIAGLGAALTHSAHGPAAACFLLPCTLFSSLAPLRGGDSAVAATFLAVGAAAMLAVFFFVKIIAANAGRRNPRTRFLRREAAGKPYYGVSSAAELEAKRAV